MLEQKGLPVVSKEPKRVVAARSLSAELSQARNTLSKAIESVSILSFDDPRVKLYGTLEHLRAMSSSSRVEIVAKLCHSASEDASLRKLLTFDLERLAQVLNPAEREQIIRVLAAADQPKRIKALILPILRSSANFAELYNSINTIGIQRLRAIKSNNLNQLIAKVVLVHELSDVVLPASDLSRDSKKILAAKLSDLRSDLSNMLWICRHERYIKQSHTAKNFEKTLLKDWKLVRELAQDWKKLGVTEIRSRLGAIIAMVDIEKSSGFHLTVRKNPDEAPRRWKKSDCSKGLRDLLRILPQKLLFHPDSPREFRRIHKIEVDVDSIQAQAQFDPNTRRIEIADVGVALKDGHYGEDAVHVLAENCAHEIGHAITMRRNAYFVADLKTGEILQGGDPRIPFEEFAKISSWQNYPRSCFKIKNSGKEVNLNGQDYNLDRPIHLPDGRVIQFTYDAGDKQLWSWDVRTQFSSRNYSFTSPWEDLAESFADYVISPRRLIDKAPQKFAFWERLFAQNRNKPEIIARWIEKAIDPATPAPAEVRTAVARQLDFVAARFDRLLASEQTDVLSKLVAQNGAHDFSKMEGPSRQQLFRELAGKSDVEMKKAFFLVFEQYEKYMPGVMYALLASLRGAKVGILTARAGKDDHKLMIDKLRWFLAVPIDSHDIYFVNDSRRSKRLADLGIHGNSNRKSQILLESVSGFFKTADGQTHKREEFEAAILIDDEQKNLVRPLEVAAEHGLQLRIMTIDSRKAKNLAIAGQILGELLRDPTAKPSARGKWIVYLDLDGMVMEVPARMYVRRKDTGEALITITQEDYSHNPTKDYWLGLAREKNPELSEQLFMDYDDFEIEERVIHQIGEHMFHRKKPEPATHAAH